MIDSEKPSDAPVEAASLPSPAGDRRSPEYRALKAKRRFYGAWTIVAGLLIAGVVVYLLNILAIPVGITIWTLIIVFCLAGPIDALERRGIGRGAGTVIAYAGMFALIVLIDIAVFSPIFGLSGQFAELLAAIPGYASDLALWATDFVGKLSPYMQGDMVDAWINDAAGSLSAWAESLARSSAEGILNLGTFVGNSMLVMGFAFVIAFWILMELPAIQREAYRLVDPQHVEDADMLRITISRVMGGYIKATLLQCALIGVVCGIIYAVLGIPSAAALGAITGLMNIIPVIGPWIGGAGAACIGLFSGPLVAFLAVLLTILVQQVVYTFVSPKLMADAVDIHPVVVLFVLMCGSAFGMAMSGVVGALVGMLLSIPVAAAGKSIFVFYFEKRTGRHLVAEDGVFFQGAVDASDDVDPEGDAMAPRPGPEGDGEGPGRPSVSEGGIVEDRLKEDDSSRR